MSDSMKTKECGFTMTNLKICVTHGEVYLGNADTGKMYKVLDVEPFVPEEPAGTYVIKLKRGGKRWKD